MSMENGWVMMRNRDLMLKTPTPTRSLAHYLKWARKKPMKPSLQQTMLGQNGELKQLKRERLS